MEFKPGAPIAFSSIKELLENNANKYPEKDAVITVNPHTLEYFSVNYLQLKDLVFKTATRLEELGVSKGDKFAILMHNTAEVIIFELAGSLIGATTVPLDSKRDTLERKIFKLEQTGAKALFETVGDESREDLKIIADTNPGLKIVSWGDFEEFRDSLPEKGPEKIYEGLDTHYVVLYTSGTTNMPKGVPLKTRSCLLNAMGIIKWQGFTENEVFNLVLPLHHINSTIFSLAVIISGGTIVMNTTYSASGFWKVVDKFHCTNSSIVPTILHDLLVRADEFFELKPEISSFKRVCIGSAPILPDQNIKFTETFGVKTIQGYGQTETSLRVTGVPVNLSEESYRELVRLNSIGVQLANCRVAILNDKNEQMKEEEEGEICISGPVLGDGYLNDTSATAFSFKEGWFHSGDLGFFKEMNLTLQDGSEIKERLFFIVGRIKEIIIKGGVNISPSAVEDVLHKNFPEIREVSVVGITDKRMGEEIAAVIVPKTGISKSQIEKEINSGEGKMEGLSSYEVPKRLFFMDELPKTSTGKIQRVEVKRQIAEIILSEKEHHLFVREIKADEDKILNEALAINNDRFKGLPSTKAEFKSRAQNGKLLGVFDEEKLLGSLSCVRLNKRDIDLLSTWDQATADGTLKNNNPEGDSLLCVAISVVGKERGNDYQNLQLSNIGELAEKEIGEYISSGHDYVLNFHSKSKAGVEGAKLYKIIKNGREDDTDSVGYNVIVKYPEINPETKLISDPNASASMKLIEFAIFYANESGIKNIYAFSRPAGFKNFLMKKYG